MKLKKLLLGIMYYLLYVMARALPTNLCLPDMSKAHPAEGAQFAVEQTNKLAPNSYTHNIIRKPAKLGYIQGRVIREDPIYKTIITYREEIKNKILVDYPEYNALSEATPAKQLEIREVEMKLIADAAIKTRCADCGEKTSLAAVLLSEAGYKGRLRTMSYYKDSHSFLLVEGDIPYAPWIADAWDNKFYPYSEWRNYLTTANEYIIGEYPNHLEASRIIYPYEIPDEEPEFY